MWYLSNDPKLSKTALSRLEDSGVRIIIPVIVLAEVKHLFSRRKISVSMEVILERIAEDDRCMVYPFDLSCLEALPTDLDLHDGMIVATALALKAHFDPEVFVITKDQAIKGSGLIPVLW